MIDMSYSKDNTGNPLDEIRGFLEEHANGDMSTDDILDFVGTILGDGSMPTADLLLNVIERGYDAGRESVGADMDAAGRNFANEVFCEMRWTYEDVATAYETVFGETLDFGDPAAVEYAQEVVFEMGDDLQDRSTEHGFEMLYDAIGDYGSLSERREEEPEHGYGLHSMAAESRDASQALSSNYPDHDERETDTR